MRHRQLQNTWVILESTTTHIPSFVTVAHTELLIFAFFVINQSEQNANELFNMRIWWRQTTWVTLVPTTTHTPSFYENRSLHSSKDLPFCWRATYIHPYMQTMWQRKFKWSFQHSWQPTKKVIPFGFLDVSHYDDILPVPPGFAMLPDIWLKNQKLI